MNYILCQFESELDHPGIQYSGQLYQEVDEQGIVARLCDLDGNTLNLEGSYGYFVINDNPSRPTWAL
jgi:hypothetical protein